ncbi:MAG: uracil-DNA glycosylase [Gammaproteobacteria bacterium HGW-Gammaproteobacteria-3]|nr:MAG: uracil-DNA glycosylase [Gammaproteobacteria bacterium HGW-Gammaproteobacteria-3]
MSDLDNAIRLQYLEAMGIEVYKLRQTPVREPIVGTEPVEAEAIKQASSGHRNAPSDTVRWTELQAEVAVCRLCGLCESRTQTVFGAGHVSADWMLIGEAPGQSEDEQGLPFVGRAGQLLTEMLRALGLRREDVFITNILKCRPPNNRDPKAEEVMACADFLRHQIAHVKPKIILAVGRVAAQNLLKTEQPLSRLRGSVQYLDDIPVIVIYHPAYLLRSLLEKRKAWEDLQLAMTSFTAIEG